MIRDLVSRLREQMREQGIAAYVVPSTDPHQSEYLPEFWKRRAHISGFTGSAGDVVVTRDAAGLWTDSRYFLQAERELDPAVFTLWRSGLPGVPTYGEWLASSVRAGEKVGVDPRLMSCREFADLKGRLQRRDADLVAVAGNLVDAVWAGRPAAPANPVEPHDVRYAGESVESKLERVRDRMKNEGAAAHVVTTLDSIAWLFNVRGADVEYNPVAIAYAIVTSESAGLYLEPGKVTSGLTRHLGAAVAIHPYEAFEAALRDLGAAGAKVWIDPATCNRWVADCLGPSAKLVQSTGPIPGFKARKNEAEIRGCEEAHLRDGVAMVRFFRWLEEAVPGGGVTERTIADKLVELRSKSELFRGPSFATIAGYGEHGAIIHYGATEETDVTLRPEGILIVDSGGQYLDGTTDITRTVTLGEPTAEQKDRFTRVLKGLIRITRTPFPEGTAGRQIDALARTTLWEAGLNFGHGVGHGIGAYLNVHEGPQAISYYRCTGVPLEPGMICSIEPGYYKTGEYGMRTENVVVVEEAPDFSPDGIGFRRFRTVTLCPIDRRLVEPSLLDPDERAWLDAYHATVRERLTPLLDPPDAAWLRDTLRDR